MKDFKWNAYPICKYFPSSAIGVRHAETNPNGQFLEYATDAGQICANPGSTIRINDINFPNRIFLLTAVE